MYLKEKKTKNIITMYASYIMPYVYAFCAYLLYYQ